MESIIDFLSDDTDERYGDGIAPGNGYGNRAGAGYSHSCSGYGLIFWDGFGDGDAPGHSRVIGTGSSSNNIKYGFGDYDLACGGGPPNGRGIKQYNGQEVYYIDGLPTIIINLRHNIAKGYVLENDLTLTPCYIAKVNGHFAHGVTSHEAVRDAINKSFQDMSEEERIAEFVKVHDYDIKYSARDLWDWHNKLTGSCEFGRNQFAEKRGIDIDNDSFTVKEFIDMCKDNYGGETIKELERFYMSES